MEAIRRAKKETKTVTNVPTMSPEARENQVINAAMNLAEQQIMDGTASSQVITYFLKLGSSKERLERDKLKSENKLLLAKVDALQSSARIEELYKDAVKAFSSYHGEEQPDDDSDIQ